MRLEVPTEAQPREGREKMAHGPAERDGGGAVAPVCDRRSDFGAHRAPLQQCRPEGRRYAPARLSFPR